MELSRLKVFARIRPALPREVLTGSFTRCLGVPKTQQNTVILTTTDKPILLDESGGSCGDGNDGLLRYQLDGVLQESSNNCQVFETVCRPLIDGLLDGTNGCLFAYGQTGSGKTHSMLGGEKDTGLILLAASAILRSCQDNEQSNSGRNKLSVSYMQIYGKEITDLLEDETVSHKSSSTRNNMFIRDNGEEVFVENLSRWNIDTVESLEALLTIGNKKRVVANTKLNATSSRSHALITFYYENESEKNIGAKLHMVDLAGSERVKASGVSGQSLKEACQINLSLFHLARVVQALEQEATTNASASSASCSSKGTLIPYKDDVLCHLLKDSLCGGATPCQTSLLAMVSPSQEHAFETSSTLKFAIGCSKIQMKRFVNNQKESNRSGGMRPWQKSSTVNTLASLKKEEARNEAKNAKLLPWSNIYPGTGSKHCVGSRVSLPLSNLKKHSSISAMIYYSSEYLAKQSRINDADNKAAAVASTIYSKVAVLLHGYPSDSEACFGYWLISALCYGGYVVLALDMPGCGRSNGPSFKSTRSEFALEKEGPADLVVEAVNSLASFDFSCLSAAGVGGGGDSSSSIYKFVQKPTTRRWGEAKVALIGLDWGGGIALMMGGSRRHKAGVSHIVAIIPSFQEKKVAELIKTPTLLLWNKDDQFHNFNSFAPIAKILKASLSSSGGNGTSSASSIAQKKNFSDLGGIKVFGDYQEYIVNKRSDPKWTEASKERCILRFLSGVEYLPEAQVLRTKPKVTALSTEGKALDAHLNIVFRPSTNSGDREASGIIYEDDILAQQQQQNFTSDEYNAVQGLKEMMKTNTLEDVLIAMARGVSSSSSTSSFDEAKKIFPRLPVLEPHRVSPSLLVQYGLWTSKAEQAAITLNYQCGLTPRYRLGNLVITPEGELARLVDINEIKKTAILESVMPKKDQMSSSRTITLETLFLMNQRHIFPTLLPPSSQKLVLEDGITCSYTSSLTKAKLCQLAISLCPLFEKIGILFEKGFSIESPEIEVVRHQCIHVLRHHVNITTFQRDTSSACGNRGRDRERYCKDDVGKFACYGEGHCHTVSSVMSACLLPFCDSILGLDLFYREDSGGHHQWLEYTLLSSKMKRFTCDLYREDGFRKSSCGSKNQKISRALLESVNIHEDGDKMLEDMMSSHLSMPVEQSYSWWRGGSNPISDNYGGYLQPAAFLKCLTGKQIQTAPIESGDLP